MAITWAPGAEFINVRRRPAGGDWEDLPAPIQALESDVAVLPDGRTVLAMHRRSINGASEDGLPDVIVARTAPRGGSFGGHEILAEDGLELTPFIRHFSMAADGSGLFAYGKGTDVLARRLSSAGVFGPADIVISGSLQDYQVGLGSDGVAVAAANWRPSSGQPFYVYGTFQGAPGQLWSPPHQLSRTGAAMLKQRSAVVFNPQGEASVWWVEKDGVGWMLRFTDLHTRGPLPLDLVVPAQVGTGIEATYSVTPSDIGGVVDVHWEWDDHTDPTTGANVKHIFGAAGTYRVKLVMTDEVAQQTIVNCNVVVGPGTPGSCDAPTTPPPDPDPDPDPPGGGPGPGPRPRAWPRSRPRHRRRARHAGPAGQAHQAEGPLQGLGRVQDDGHLHRPWPGGHHHRPPPGDG